MFILEITYFRKLLESQDFKWKLTTKLGSAPNQEFLTLMLNLRIAFLRLFAGLLLGLGIRGSNVIFFWFGLGLEHTMVCDVELVCIRHLVTC